MNAPLWSFRGGLHLPYNKELSSAAAIRPGPIPARITLPMQQHIGEPAEPVVKLGDRVLKGQVIARAGGFVSVPVHASTSGKVVDIGEYAIPHPSGLKAPCIVIESDGRDEWVGDRRKIPNFAALDPSELRDVIREAGIVGLGGAAFPTFIKLNPGRAKVVDTLIINGAECEPYITADDRLMRERSAHVVSGLLAMRHALQAKNCIVGIEDNKPEAYAAIAEAVARLEDPSIRVARVPTRYPMGGEKQLIQVLTGKEVPSRALPLAIGVICHNLSTAVAVHRAVVLGEPLISRVVTVTGQGVVAPCNVESLLGTPIADLIDAAAGYTPGVKRLIMGGPMMGFALPSDELPTVKATNCILAAARDELAEGEQAMPCIRCGECSNACPVNLLPQQMYWFARSRNLDAAQDHNLFDCIECGCCAYVCPSRIPLVHYFRFAKGEIAARDRERKLAERARLRHDLRQARLEREKAEREERMRLVKAAAAAKKSEDEASKRDIADAAARVAEKKAAAPAAGGDNVVQLADHPRKRITDIEKRARPPRVPETTESGEDDS